MSSIFNFGRFTRLLKKHTREHIKTYLMGMVVLMIVLAGIFFFNIYNTRNSSISIDNQSVFYFLTLYLGTFLFAASTFKDYHGARSGIALIMLPASVFEKFLLHALLTCVGFAVCHFLTFHLTQLIVFEASKQLFGSEIVYYNVFENQTSSPVLWLFLLYLFVHSVGLLGSIGFTKRSIVYTLILTTAIGGLLIYFNHLITFKLFGGHSTPFPIMPIHLSAEKNWIEIAFDQAEIIGIVLAVVIFSLLWVTAFFKLKEKEI